MDIYRSKYNVDSFTNPSVSYVVSCDRENGNGPKINWTCTCPHHQNRKVECKHIREMKYSYYPKAAFSTVVIREESANDVLRRVNGGNVLRIPTDLQNALKIVQDATKAGMTFTAKYEFNVLTMTLGRS